MSFTIASNASSASNIQSPFQASLASPVESQMLGVAASISPLEGPSQVIHSINNSKNLDWKQVAIRTLNFCSSIALGSFSGLALAGVMVSPMGWAIAGSAFLIGFLGAMASGDSKEFMVNVGISLSGFALGAAPGFIAPSSISSMAMIILAELLLVVGLKLVVDFSKSNNQTESQVNEIAMGSMAVGSSAIAPPPIERRRAAGSGIPLAPDFDMDGSSAATPRKYLLNGEPEAPDFDRSQYKKLGRGVLEAQIGQIESYLGPFSTAVNEARAFITSEETLKARLTKNKQVLDENTVELVKHKSQLQIFAEAEEAGSTVTYAVELLPGSITDITYFSEAARHAANEIIDEQNARLDKLNKELIALGQKPRTLIPRISDAQTIAQATIDLQKIIEICKQENKVTKDQIQDDTNALIDFEESPIGGDILEFKEVVAAKEALLGFWQSALNNRKARLKEILANPSLETAIPAEPKALKASASEVDKINEAIRAILQDPALKGLPDAKAAGNMKALGLHKREKLFNKGVIQG